MTTVGKRWFATTDGGGLVRAYVDKPIQCTRCKEEIDETVHEDGTREVNTYIGNMFKWQRLQGGVGLSHYCVRCWAR